MTRKLTDLPWVEVAAAVERGQRIILPTGATEAHGPHLPLDTDTHQAEHIALLLADRVDALVAPAIPYGVSKTFEHFAGTVSLSIPMYQKLVYEVGMSLIKQGFHDLILLNGNRPNGTSNDAVARQLVDDLDQDHPLHILAVSYWEPAAERIHSMRSSRVGGMGHACEFETSFQLATRPELVHLDSLDGVYAPLVGWDLVAPVQPSRLYTRRPDPESNHCAIFGDPHCASGDSGIQFIDAVVDSLANLVQQAEPSYEEAGR